MAEYTSIRQVATRLGVTHTTASKHLRRKDFPIKRTAPWTDDDAAEWQVWMRECLQPDRSSPDHRGAVTSTSDDQDKDYWLTRKYRAQALQQEGELLDTSAVMRAWTQTIGDIRDQMLLLPAAVQGLLNLTDQQTKQLDDFLRRTLEGVADRVGDLADAAQVVSGDGEGDQTAEAAESKSMGGDASVYAEVDDSGSGSVEE